MLCLPAAGLDPGKSLTQYAHTAWRIQEGSYSGAPQAIAQTSDGYLWIGTSLGLFRFDGVRFTALKPPGDQQLLDPRIFDLLAAHDGSLWIGTGFGVSHWQDGQLTNYAKISGRIEALAEDSTGAVWLIRTQVTDDLGPICRIKGGAVDCYGVKDGLPDFFPMYLAGGSAGDIWVGGYWNNGDSEICLWQPGAAPANVRRGDKHLVGASALKAIASEADGSIWAAIEDPRAPLRLDRFEAGRWMSQTFPDIPLTNADVMSLYVDRDGSLWISTSLHGLFRVKHGVAEHFGNGDGLSSDAAGRFFQDLEGSVWVTNAAGVDSFRDQWVTNYSMREGLAASGAGALAAARNGDVWVANFRAVDLIRENRLSALLARKGLPGQDVTTVFEDHAGRLWMGIDNGLWVYDGATFRAVLHRDGTPIGTVFTITEDTQNDIWVRAALNLDRIENLQLKEEISSPQIKTGFILAANPKGGIVLGLVNGDLLFYHDGATQVYPSHELGNRAQIRDLAVDRDGSVWATNLNELVRLKDGKRENLSRRNGLPCDSVFALVKDPSEAIWLYTSCGVLKIEKAELDRWWANPRNLISYKLVDELDGMQPGLTPLKPQAVRTPDGRLWFVNGRFLQMLDPLHPRQKPSPTSGAYRRGRRRPSHLYSRRTAHASSPDGRRSDRLHRTELCRPAEGAFPLQARWPRYRLAGCRHPKTSPVQRPCARQSSLSRHRLQ